MVVTNEVWMPEQELTALLGRIVEPVTFSDIYLTIAKRNDPESVLAVGGKLTGDPRDFEQKVLGAFLETGSLDDRALRFCKAYDFARNIPVAPGKEIPLIYVVNFVHENLNPEAKEQDRLSFERIEILVPQLNEWVLFNLAVSNHRYSADMMECPPFRYRQTIVGHQGTAP